MPSRKSSGQAGRERDRWTPIRRGKIYCSPGCGGGCTVAEHDEAVAAGERLVRRLKGKGWSAVIHENMGWHHRAVSGPVSIYCSEGVDGPRYWCLMSDDPNKGGYGCPLWDSPSGTSGLPTLPLPHALRAPSGKNTEGRARRFKDPNDAVKDIVARASKVISKLFHAVIAAREAAGMSIKAAGMSIKAVDVLLLPTYRVFEITSEGEESEMERVHVTSTDEDLISVLKHMKLLPRRLPESRISEDFDRGTWTIYVKDVPGECKGFRPFLKLVGPWNEAMS